MFNVKKIKLLKLFFITKEQVILSLTYALGIFIIIKWSVQFVQKN